ncbi:MAG TPA: peptidoglycan-binding protein [Candidatus Paceibacterota bacterium]|nr:peptidoglycan-binding protein [Candidatus Paceibacterota bacterium]HRZ34413.1 peptidoglycan-binding protein [Candidatus Paceibacterota bacterium]
MNRFYKFGLMFVLAAALFFSAARSVQALTMCSFTRDLTVGSSGEDVRCLQQYLNAVGYTIANTGAGSLGQETTYFGNLTAQAVAKWQAGNDISPTAGYFGTISRARYAEIFQRANDPAGADARAAIAEASSYIAEARRAFNQADGDGADRTEDIIKATFSDLSIASDFYQDGEYNKAEDSALRAVRGAKYALGALDDSKDYEDNRSGAKEVIQNTEDAIKDAEDAIEDAEEATDESEADDYDIDGAKDILEEAQDLLEESQDLLNEAEEAFDDRDYDEAIDSAEDALALATDAQEIAEDAADIADGDIEYEDYDSDFMVHDSDDDDENAVDQNDEDDEDDDEDDDSATTDDQITGQATSTVDTYNKIVPTLVQTYGGSGVSQSSTASESGTQSGIDAGSSSNDSDETEETPEEEAAQINDSIIYSGNSAGDWYNNGILNPGGCSAGECSWGT